MEIQKDLTTRNYNSENNPARVQYIVIHYTANNGDTAKANTDYFKTAYRGASAHYFVDERSIWQCVADGDIAWHCGTSGTYVHPKCRNKNSIGVELCSRKTGSTYYFKEETVKHAAELVKRLMKQYGVPVERVLRHYDVTGKICPEPFVRQEALWQDFLGRLADAPKELESANDITWELNHTHFPIEDAAGFVTALEEAKKQNSPLYWGYYKLVNDRK